MGGERLIRRLTTFVGVPVEDGPEDGVDPGHGGRSRAEVLRQALEPSRTPRLAFDDPLHLVVERDVGATKTVDGLLGIADDEQLAGRERHLVPGLRHGLTLAQKKGDLGLQGIGVLELVYEDEAKAFLQRAPRGEVAGKQVAQAAEQVREVEPAVRDLGGAGPAREGVGDRDGKAGQIRGVGLALRQHEIGDDTVSRPQLVLAAHAGVPLALVATGSAFRRTRGQGKERGREPVDVTRRLVEEPPRLVHQLDSGRTALVPRVCAGGGAELVEPR